MQVIRKKPNYWTKERVLEEILKHDNHIEFKKANGSAFKAGNRYLHGCAFIAFIQTILTSASIACMNKWWGLQDEIFPNSKYTLPVLPADNDNRWARARKLTDSDQQDSIG